MLRSVRHLGGWPHAPRAFLGAAFWKGVQMSVSPELPFAHHRVCDCGKAIRGEVPAASALTSAGPLFATLSPTVPAHFCLQCSPEHCKMRAFIVAEVANRDHPWPEPNPTDPPLRPSGGSSNAAGARKRRE